MKVKQLQEKLAQLDPDHDVVCYLEESENLPKGDHFRLFDIDTIDTHEAEKSRVEGRPYLKFGKSEDSEKLVLISIMSDF